MKLSEAQLRRFTIAAMHCGEEFGIYPDVKLPADIHHYWTAAIVNDDCIFGYSLFIDTDFFYFCIDSVIVRVRRSFHTLLGIEEMALFLYLVFCKHQIFDL